MTDRIELPNASTQPHPEGVEPTSFAAQPVPSPRSAGFGDAWDLPAAFNAFGAPAGGAR